MLKKIKEDVENLIQEYSILFECIEGYTDSVEVFEIKEQLNNHMFSLISLKKLFDLLGEIVIVELEVEKFEVVFKQANEILEYHMKCYDIYIKEFFVIKVTLEAVCSRSISWKIVQDNIKTKCLKLISTLFFLFTFYIIHGIIFYIKMKKIKF